MLQDKENEKVCYTEKSGADLNMQLVNITNQPKKLDENTKIPTNN